MPALTGSLQFGIDYLYRGVLQLTPCLSNDVQDDLTLSETCVIFLISADRNTA